MNAIFGDRFYRRYILELFKNLCRLWVLRICFSQFFQDTLLYIECPFRHSYVITYKSQLSSKRRHTEAVLHLNNRLNAPLKFRNLNTFIRIFIRNTPVLALKISKRGWARVFWATVLWLCFKFPVCLFCHTRDTSVFKWKQKLFILFKCNLDKRNSHLFK